MRLCGGRTKARSTTAGLPFSSRKDTSASPDAELGDRRLDVDLGVLRGTSRPPP
ncbi:MAG: hypothetical protein MZV64_12600 [Ignavibacteriales bacterium]|nr:hypothetical protein [Ignavibacteriales bacterium]